MTPGMAAKAKRDETRIGNNVFARRGEADKAR